MNRVDDTAERVEQNPHRIVVDMLPADPVEEGAGLSNKRHSITPVPFHLVE